MLGIVCKVFSRDGEGLIANPAYMAAACVQYSPKYLAMIVTGIHGDIMIKHMSASFYSKCMERVRRDIREGRAGTDFNSEGAFWGFQSFNDAVSFIEGAPELFAKSAAAWDAVSPTSKDIGISRMRL